jgi:pyruvate/2-oxoacid:ferredoxin oxidoreductase alpha subunit
MIAQREETGRCRLPAAEGHVIALTCGLGETSIVGSGLPVAAGAALGSKMQGTDRVTLCFFGDGASNEGTFHESLNLAAIWTLPVVYVCENSGYGELSAVRLVVSVPDISARAAGYGIPGVTVDGQDVVAVYEAVSEAVARARRGEGPSLVETKTYRFHEHAFGLPDRAYRDQAEVDEWRKRDPVELFRARLLAEGMLDEAAVKALEDAVSAEIEAAIEFAESSPYPSADAAFDYPDEDYIVPLGQADVKREGSEVTVVAISGAVRAALAAADQLASAGVSVEVVDPRSLVPMDYATILSSVRKTGRLVVADPSHRTCSPAAEIAATVAEDGFWSLQAPIVRVTTPDTHIPFSPPLEAQLYPSPDRIAGAVRQTLK